MMAKRPKQAYRVDKDAVEISQYFEGAPIVLEVLPVNPERFTNPHIKWENEFKASCTLYGVCIEGKSNYIDGAIANLYAKVQEHMNRELSGQVEITKRDRDALEAGYLMRVKAVNFPNKGQFIAAMYDGTFTRCEIYHKERLACGLPAPVYSVIFGAVPEAIT